jgi:hypothetical protein
MTQDPSRRDLQPAAIAAAARPPSTNIDDDLDLDSSVELDGSEAIRGRLTPPSTSTSPRWSRSAEPCSTRSVDVQRRGWAQRRTSPSTSTPWVNEQVDVDVDDHERHVEDL